MRNIPMFTTENGVAGLTLNQIPYRKKAYIRIHSSAEPLEFLEECISFCRACGAEKVFATGISDNLSYKEHTKIIKMQADMSILGNTDASVFPATEKTIELWREIYNKKSESLPTAFYMTSGDKDKMLKEGDCYFVHRNGKLLGIGKASGEQIFWISAEQPGAGEDVVRAMCHILSSDTVFLEVSSQNEKAIKLYEKMGFLPVGVEAVWYQIF